MVGGFFVCFLEGGTRRPLHKTKICQFIELKVGNRKMAQTFFFPPFSSLKAMSSSLATPSPSTFMPCLYPIGFFFLPSPFPFIFLPYFVCVQ